MTSRGRDAVAASAGALIELVVTVFLGGIIWQG